MSYSSPTDGSKFELWHNLSEQSYKMFKLERKKEYVSLQNYGLKFNLIKGSQILTDKQQDLMTY